MKPVAVLYATREGHTRKVAEAVVRSLVQRGLEAVAFDVRIAAPYDLSAYSAVVLAASVHMGRHEPEMIAYVKQHREQLGALPAAFLSVTLSEASAERGGATPEEHARFVREVESMTARFVQDTGWHPTHLVPVAGALRYTQYNFLVRFIMKRIATKAGASTDTTRDHDYTDWTALDRFVGMFADEIAQGDVPERLARA
jgi:menaquinone-dependent protoporphyrinogen oxidase